MSLNDKTEGNSIAELARDNEILGLQSRSRSIYNDTWSEVSGRGRKTRRSRTFQSHQRDRSAGRHDEHAPDVASQNFSPSVHSQERGRNDRHSTGPRQRSTDAVDHLPEPKVTGSEQAPVPKNGRALRDLDLDNPGDWAINHHMPSLVTELDPKTSSIGSTVLTYLGTKFREKWYGRKAVSTELPTSSSPKDPRRFRISFAEVQRMRIRKLQCELVRHVVKMRRDGQESPGWEGTLEEYIKALRDHDYMEHRSKSIRDPFLATGEYGVDNYVLNKNIGHDLAKDIDNYVESVKTWDDDSDQSGEPITGTRGRNLAKTWYRGFRERLMIAAAGGAFLVGPMWIMVLNSGLYTSLISTTAFVIVFGITMACFLDEAKDVLGSTAAYAAVLVVFVGTSNP